MISKNQRIIIGFFVGLLALLAGAVEVSMVFINVNPKESSFFLSDEYFSEYKYTSDSYSETTSDTLRFEIVAVGTTATARITHGSDQVDIETDSTGLVYIGGVKSEYYTIFFIPIPSAVDVPFQSNIGRNISVIDSLGVISGEPNSKFIVRIDRLFVLWSTTISSQASFEASIYDADDDRKVCSAIYDATSGFLFILESFAMNYKSLELQTTNFLISRNRIFMLWSALIIIAGLLVIVPIYLYKINETISNEDKKTITLLFYIGLPCSLVDMILDTWYFEIVDPLLYILLFHGILILLLLIVAKKFAIPALFELGIIGVYYTFDGQIAPMVAFFPGLLISWLCWLFIQNFEEIKEESLIKQIFSKLLKRKEIKNT